MSANDSPTPRLSRRNLIGIGGGAAITLATSALALPGTAHAQQTITTNQTGTHDGYFYAFSNDVEGTAAMTLGPGGNYGTSWRDSGSFVSGKGWSTGGPRVVNYSGSVDIPDGEAYLCVHGWTINPLVEYFIIDYYGPYRPQGQLRGVLSVDGGTYDLMRTMRYNAPSPEGVQTFPQFWSVRQAPRIGGTIDTGVHFEAWAQAGMILGTFVSHLIVAMVGYQSSGNADITVG